MVGMVALREAKRLRNERWRLETIEEIEPEMGMRRRFCHFFFF
jgi:hypothetical protein